MRAIEIRYGGPHFAPLDCYGTMNDYEVGLLNGKLSALRSVLGFEWDFLDT